MKKTRESIQANILDWSFLIIGLFLIGYQIYKYTQDEITNYGLEIGVFCVGILFLTKPQTLTDIASKIVNKKSTNG